MITSLNHSALRVGRRALPLSAIFLALGLLFLSLPITRSTRAAGVAQQAEQPQPPRTGKALSSILNPDGTVNRKAGVSGSFDVRGYRMALGARGEPRFVPQTAGCADDWDDRFGLLGADNTVFALAVAGTDLYVGGGFDAVGDIAANRVAKWDGSSWSPLGTPSLNGIEGGGGGYVTALAFVGTDLYVAGAFGVASDSTISNLQVNNIARWSTTGNTWSPLGSQFQNGVDAPVEELAVSGTDLYVGGQFSTARSSTQASVPVNNIARWSTTGNTWSPLGSPSQNGVNGFVSALAVSGTDVYVGGFFTGASSSTQLNVLVNNVARWSTTANTWSPLGSPSQNGADLTVYTLAAVGTDIFVGGQFTHVSDSTQLNTPVSFIARWSTTANTWSPLGSPSQNGVIGTVFDLAVNGTDLYVGGLFIGAKDNSGTIDANHIAKWSTTGNNWSLLGDQTQNGVDDWVYALAMSGTDLVAAGTFSSSSSSTQLSLPTLRVARWTAGNAWSALGALSQDGADSDVIALAVVGTDLYVGGSFTTVGGVAANNIAKWNGSSWSRLGSASQNGVFGGVLALAALGTDLYVGGFFPAASDSTQGFLPVNHIARWSIASNTWSPLGSPSQNGVNGGDGIEGVWALAVTGTNLYVGGDFTTASDSTQTGLTVNNVARWSTTGNTWSPLGTPSQNGVNNFVFALATIGTDVYAGGWFTTASDSTQLDMSANRVARWSTTGNTWSPLGSASQNGVGAPSGGINAMAASGTDLYVGGQFETASSATQLNISANRVAKWSTTSNAWSPLGTSSQNGVNGNVMAFAVSGTDLYVGGSFLTASSSTQLNIPVNGIARWDGNTWSDLDGGVNEESAVNAYPVRALAVMGTNLYAGGQFTIAGCTVSGHFARRTIAASNTPPSITAQSGVSRQQGAPAVNSQIATVNDVEDAENALSVSVSPDGVHFGSAATLNPCACTGGHVMLSNIAVSPTGSVTADIVAGCAASNVSFTLRVTDSAGASSTATLNLTVTPETQLPQITCPANITRTVTTPGSPVVITYPTPSASDNCGSVNIACSPPSGSAFSAGVTTVNCQATDGAGNMRACSFTVTAYDYDVCIKDDATMRILRFNSITGGWEFLDCRKAPAVIVRGAGTVARQGCKLTLTNASSKTTSNTVSATANTCTFAATVTARINGVNHTLTDSNMRDSPCTCSP